MAQYNYYTDPATGLRVRDGVREIDGNINYVIDKELTATGFSGDENTDWENIGGAE